MNLEEANLWFSKAAQQGIKQAAKILATPSRSSDNGLKHFNHVKPIKALGFSENEK